ncbi:hypothetical protein Lser_V15G38703 [Lactuca serriola]
MFIFKKGLIHLVALIYVDDILLMGNDDKRLNEVKAYLQTQFSIKDLGLLKYFLGIGVARSAEGFVISQRKYTLDILKDSRIEGSHPSSFPMEQNLKLHKDDDSSEVDASRYRRLVGRLLYLTVTHPGITFSVNQLSQFLAKPRKTHMDAAYRVLRYLKTTPGQGLFLPSSGNLELMAYCDASWLSCPSTRKSCTSYFISLGGSPISWRTKKQSVVARSSAEAEYRSMANTVCEVVWLRWLLQDFDATQKGPTPLMCDNDAARHIVVNPVYHERTKHVEMDLSNIYLRNTIVKARENPGGLLKGFEVCLATHVQPPVSTMSAIVRSTGGNVIRSFEKAKDLGKTIFVASEEGMEEALSAVKKGIATFSNDWFMNCVMK